MADSLILDSSSANPDRGVGYPQYFRIAGHWVNSYKVFLCVGLYGAILVISAFAERSGLSPLSVGLGCLVCAVGALFGARIYHLLVFAPVYLRQKSWASVWDSRRGGWSVFGGLPPLVLGSWLLAVLLHISPAVLWDFMSAGVLFGGFWVRLGCVFNGCCCGRETTSRLGMRLHDTRGVRKRRIPVQFLEMGWWVLGWIGFLAMWPRSLAHGAYALGVVAWYGLGRFWLEPLREKPDLVAGKIRVNQVVAAALAISAAIGLLILLREV